MEGLFSLLLVAGLFFIMMRFSCGAHISHGRQPEGHARHGAADGGNIDPVCGMHRWHRFAISAPFVFFPVLYFLPWNPIYPGIVSLQSAPSPMYCAARICCAIP